MNNMHCRRLKAVIYCFCVIILFTGTQKNLFGQGVCLRAVSAINEGMGGAATGTPTDTVGALHWNPATIGAMEGSDISFGSAIILARSEVASSLLGREGRTTSDTGAVPAPFMGMRMKDPNRPLTYGFGLYAVGGAQVNYPGDSNNPILDEHTPGGIGRTSAKVEAFQMTPTVALALGERLFIGASPTIFIGRLIAEPLFFGPMDSSRHWAKGAGTRYIWGGGFQVGLYYKAKNHFNFGLNYKSQQWTEKFPYNVVLDGNPYEALFSFNFPTIYCAGVSYDGIENTIIGVDFRYIDHENMPGMGPSGLNPDGSIKGLGWKNIFCICLGVQRKLSDQWTVRCGYSFNEALITPEMVTTNTPCPLLMQHGLHVGTTVRVFDAWDFTLGYAHMFEASTRGKNAAWNVVDSNNYVESTSSADALQFGVNHMF